MKYPPRRIRILDFTDDPRLIVYFCFSFKPIVGSRILTVVHHISYLIECAKMDLAFLYRGYLMHIANHGQKCLGKVSPRQVRSPKEGHTIEPFSMAAKMMTRSNEDR